MSHIRFDQRVFRVLHVGQTTSLFNQVLFSTFTFPVLFCPWTEFCHCFIALVHIFIYFHFRATVILIVILQFVFNNLLHNYIYTKYLIWQKLWSLIHIRVIAKVEKRYQLLPCLMLSILETEHVFWTIQNTTLYVHFGV